MKQNNRPTKGQFQNILVEEQNEGKIIALPTKGIANPAPLGLLAFGMTTVLLNLHNAGLFPLNAMILAMGLCYGGLAQIIAGIMEFKKNNTFGATAFTSYGLFWWSLVLIWFNPFGNIASPDKVSMGYYLLMWGIFTAFLFVGTLKQIKALRVVFCTLTLLFFLLALGDFLMNESITQIAGFVGIICGASAIYAGMAQVLNEVYKKTIMKV